jgi:MSHA biogenesis protein MshQ
MSLARLAVLFVLATLPLGAAIGASQTRSPAVAGDCTSVGAPPLNWTNPGNAVSSNDAYATVSVDGNTSDPLRCLNYAFNVPLTATVVGIEVFIERRSNRTQNGGSRDASVLLVKSGAPTGTNGATATTYPTTDTVEAHGAPTDLWGTTWTPAEVNAANFGAQLAVTKPNGAGAAHTISVDHIYITVHYSEPPPAPTLVSPADGATVNTSSPAFDWTDVVDPDGDAVTYEIQADDSGCGFASLEIDQTGLATSDFTPVSLANGTYCWRARAVDALGAPSPWSATWSVTVSAPVPLTQTASPGSCVTAGGPGNAWANPGNAVSSNNAYATSNTDGSATEPLRCTNYGFSLPLNAVIAGVEVFVERRSNRTQNGGSRDDTLFLVKGGAPVGSNRATTTIYTTSDFVEGHGGASDLWGTTWTAAEINAANFGTQFSAIKPNGAGQQHVISVDHISVTVHYFVPVAAPGSFNAFETSTAAGAINGVIRTKVAGAPFSLDVVAIESGAQFGAFGDTVTVELLGNTTLGVALDANNCPTTSTTLQTVSPDPTITGGRATVAFAAVADVWRDVRVRVGWPAGAPTVTSCSTDNFAIRPNAFANFALSDTDWENAGTGRALSDTAFGAIVHKAGRPVSVRASAVNAAGTPAVTANYSGTPGATLSACVGAACTPAQGALALNAAFAGGQLVTDVASYDNVGAFRVQLTDTEFSVVDAGDGSTPAERNIASAAIDVGRFVPDHFTVSLNTPELGTGCSGFTYLGQRFAYTTAPVITVTARNFAGNPASFYEGAWWRITNSSLAPATQAGRYSAAGAVGLDLALLPGTNADPVVAASGAGVGTLTFSSGTGIAFNRTTPVAPFDAEIALAIDVIDADGVAYAGNPASFGAASAGNGIAFDDGKAQRFGRLRLQNAYGPDSLPLRVGLETQYWSGTGFVLNAQDSCTSLDREHIALGSYTQSLNACDTAVVEASVALSGGRATLTLAAAGAGNAGTVTLTPVLGALGAQMYCPAKGGAEAAAASAQLPHLQGAWSGAAYDDDPSAQAAFGLYGSLPKNFIFLRENY